MNIFMTTSDLKKAIGKKYNEGSGSTKYRSIKPLIVDAVQVSGPADVPNRGGVMHATVGDWMVLDAQGNLRVYHDHYFRHNYAPLKGSSSLDQFRELSPGGGC